MIIARLSTLYFLFFVTFAATVPYLGRFLTANGFSEGQVGIAFAFFSLMMIPGSFVWASLSDRLGRRLWWVRISFVLIAISHLLLWRSASPWVFMSSIALLGLWIAAAQSQMEAVAMDQLVGQENRYAQVRLWGSIGYIVLVFVFGLLLSRTQMTAQALPLVAILGAALAFASTFIVREPPLHEHHSSLALKGFWRSLKQRKIWVLFTVTGLLQFSLSPYNTFLDLYLTHKGFPAEQVGSLIAVSVLFEVGLFALLSRLLQRYSAVWLWILALGLTVVRWLLMALLGDSWWMAFFIQTLHAFTFAVTHGVTIYLIGRWFPTRQQGRAQGLYVAFAVGIMPFLGNLLMGRLWEMWSPESMWVAASIAVAVATLLALWGLPKSEDVTDLINN